MPKTQKRSRKLDGKSQRVRTTKQRLLFLTIFFIVVALTLTFKVGELFWPVWIIEHRTQFIGVVLFALLFLILWSPVMIEVSRNPRTLSGPGETDWLE